MSLFYFYTDYLLVKTPTKAENTNKGGKNELLILSKLRYFEHQLIFASCRSNCPSFFFLDFYYRPVYCLNLLFPSIRNKLSLP